MANLETPPTPLYNSNMFNDLSEMSRIMKDNDEALNDDIANAGATDAGVAAFVADPSSDTREELDTLYAGQGGDTSALEPGGRLGEHIGGTTGDLNDLTETGWYQSSGTGDDNRPSTTGSLEIQVVGLASDSVFQTARTHGSAGSPYEEEWVRDYRGPNAGWSAWRPIRTPRTTRPPVFSNGISLGNGSAVLHEWISGGTVHQSITINVGSSTNVTADLRVDTGYPAALGGSVMIAGDGRYNRSGSVFDMMVLLNAGQAYLRLRKSNANGYVMQVNANDITSWGAGSVVSAAWSFPLP